MAAQGPDLSSNVVRSDGETPSACVDGRRPEGRARRRVRSFVKREGRLTPGQQRALDALGPRWLVPVDGTRLAWDRLFAASGVAAPAVAGPSAADDGHGDFAPAEGLVDGDVILEIGFGDGASLAWQAAHDPARRFLGVEVHRPGVGRLLLEIERRGLHNLRAVEQDAVELLERIDDGALAGVQVFFPDPWHKKRHHKRRLIQPDFLVRLARVVRAGGYLHLATDWADYAHHMQQVLATLPTLWQPDGEQPLAARPRWRAETKFERRGLRLGHAVSDLLYRRTATPPEADRA